MTTEDFPLCCAGISDVRDESDRDGMRVVVEVKRGSSPEVRGTATDWRAAREAPAFVRSPLPTCECPLENCTSWRPGWRLDSLGRHAPGWQRILICASHAWGACSV